MTIRPLANYDVSISFTGDPQLIAEIKEISIRWRPGESEDYIIHVEGPKQPRITSETIHFQSETLP